MGDAVLPSLIFALTIVAIVSAILLVRAAIIRPHVGALTERALLATVLALFGVAYSIVAINFERDAPWFTIETGRAIVRIGVVVVLSVPAWWTALYLTGRLR